MPPTRLLLLRPRLPRSRLLRPRPSSPKHVQHLPTRTFLSSILPSPLAPQTLTASRRLPYAPAAVYALIADIDGYSAFLPYCGASRVTAWTARPDPVFGRRWPARADLTAGWGGLEQTYTSRVFCVPGSVVEALSGEGARSGIAPDVLARHGLRDDDEGGGGGGGDAGLSSASLSASTAVAGGGGNEGVFKTLVTRWTVTPVASGQTTTTTAAPTAQWSDVDLNIRFQFANPLYAAVSSAVADKVAPVMIEAFVERARKVLGSGAR
ncbi:hypothetical protein F5B18DRAFT_607142 [Nemania serpens]|nr:hypothetical protein F5B18DRAFT_607142 [Nemania serpens]